MNGKHMVIDMILSFNREELEKNDIVMGYDSMTLSDPWPTDVDGFNTKVGATAIHPKVEGDQFFYYSRLDQALFEAQLTQPPREIPAEVKTSTQLVAYFASEFGTELDLDDVNKLTRTQSSWIVEFKSRSYVWLGTFTFAAVNDGTNPGAIPLSDILVKDELEGLNYPDSGV